MSFRAVFPNRHAILPVIHVEDAPQAQRNAAVAFDGEADGIFLINHGLSDAALLQIHAQVVADWPGRWIGVNCLGWGVERTFREVGARADGIWVDNAAIDERSATQPAAEAHRAAREAAGFRGLYFGGVAFKYQRDVSDLERAAQIAGRYVDVITTSGPGTGRAADVQKIARIKRAAGEVPVAIASGITPQNVSQFLPHADAFLVATGISSSFEELDPRKLVDLVSAVRGWSGGVR